MRALEVAGLTICSFEKLLIPRIILFKFSLCTKDSGFRFVEPNILFSAPPPLPEPPRKLRTVMIFLRPTKGERRVRVMSAANWCPKEAANFSNYRRYWFP